MSDKRTNIIIEEINYWKQHKLLPDVYCDFLLALYSKGEDTSKLTNKNKAFKITQIVRITLLFIMLLLSFLLVYFLEMESIWQTILLIVILIFSSSLYILLRRNQDFAYHFGMVIVLAIYFIASIHISTLYIKNQQILYFVLFSNFIAWFYVGQKQRLKYLKITSIIFTVFTVIYIISRYFMT